MAKFFYNKVSGIVIDDGNYGKDHAWSPDRIVNEIVKNIENVELKNIKGVNLKDLKNEDILVFNSTTNQFENKKLNKMEWKTFNI
ncbi:hypothetical protein Bp8pS_257 [Bacillus phage vB_BpuM-BpSp]|nr:hypothetical protein Bp8pS_257 [Bacillus phage vB_BpuM-BpSp]